MDTIRSWFSLRTVVCVFVVALSGAHKISAQIIIGQTAGFTGPVSAGVMEVTRGARLYIDHVNASGGVNGEQIDLRSLDDGFIPERSADNARKLIREGAVAMFLTRATPNTEAVLPLLPVARVPLVAPSTGAKTLHQPVNPWVFNVRSTYQQEAERAIVLLKAMAITSIGVLHVNDSFGRDALEGLKRGYSATQISPAFSVAFDRLKPDFTSFRESAIASQPQAVLVVGSAAATIEAVKLLRSIGSQAQVVTLSNNSSSGFVRDLGAHGPGVIVAQVFPSERSLTSKFVLEARLLAKAREAYGVSPSMLEGFAAAKVLVEGLRRAGKKASGIQIRNALETIREFDLGSGLLINYSPSNHTGLSYVDLSIIGRTGGFVR